MTLFLIGLDRISEPVVAVPIGYTTIKTKPTVSTRNVNVTSQTHLQFFNIGSQNRKKR